MIFRSLRASVVAGAGMLALLLVAASCATAAANHREHKRPHARSHRHAAAHRRARRAHRDDAGGPFGIPPGDSCVPMGHWLQPEPRPGGRTVDITVDAGILESASPSALTVNEGSDGNTTVPIAPQVEVTLDAAPAAVSDLQPGDVVSVVNGDGVGSFPVGTVGTTIGASDPSQPITCVGSQ
jgi:hypothetical protein